jgi:2-keto-myo-inositol isomerase
MQRMQRRHSRRAALRNAGAWFAAAAAVPGLEASVKAQENRDQDKTQGKRSGQAAARQSTGAEPFGYCLNTSTIRGQNLPLAEEIDIASKAGFSAIEPWIGEIEQHVKKGGTLKDLAKHIADAGLTVESAIGFAEWIVDDDARRSKGLEQAKRDMDLVAQIGGKRIAAPPVGAHEAKHASPELMKIAERYRALLDLGQQMGVTPELELWGFSKTLSRMGEVAFVAIEAGHPQSCILLDVYHIYKGGSDLSGLKLLNGKHLPVLHLNDYPAAPPREKITDAHRVYPGDGVAPLPQIFRDLRDIGFRGFLSVELFNKDYWKQNPQKVAQTAFEKARAAVRGAALG